MLSQEPFSEREATHMLLLPQAIASITFYRMMSVA
jgi:hypothetical protein